MSYRVLARKWRPNLFSDLVGQKHVVKSLSYALDTNSVHHAYLFTGTRGVGKTSIARIFAKSLNCETSGVSSRPCDQCSNCLDINAGKFVDLIEVDAASRTGVDETRELIESVAYLPAKGHYKVYLIDEVHMFSKSSFNALLKTLEEPPEYVKFILATTDPEKLPITILSRCLQFNLKSLTDQQITNHLTMICNAESIDFDDKSIELIAKAGRGSVRDSLSLLDQAVAYGQGKLETNTIVELLGTINPADIQAILYSLVSLDAKRLYQQLRAFDDYDLDSRAFLIELMRQLQDIAWEKEGVDVLLDPQLIPYLSRLSKSLIQLWYDICDRGLIELEHSLNPQKTLEMTLLRMLAFVPESISSISAPVLDKKDLVAEKATAKEVHSQTSLEASEADFLGEVVADEQNTVAEVAFDEQSTASGMISDPSIHASQEKIISSLDDSKENFVGNNQSAEKEDEQLSEPLSHALENEIDLKDSWHLSEEETEQSAPTMQEVLQKMEPARNISVDKTTVVDEMPVDDAPWVSTKESVIEVKEVKSEDKKETLKKEEEVQLSQEPITGVQKTEPFDWFSLFKQLKLSDFTREFAGSGILDWDIENAVATLTIDPKNEVLKTEKGVLELEQVLQDILFEKLHLNIKLGEVDETPSERLYQLNEIAQQKKIQDFKNNTIVTALVNELGAVVIDKTIQ